MIKHINHQNVSTTPFVAAKSRDLYNVQSPTALVTETAVYPDGTQISLDYVDYNSGNPVLNRDCDIALEQQDADLIQYEEGITGSGTFNSASDPRNVDGTYKSLVHRQIENAFYNSYRNPTEIFGVEHIDFPLSNTLRNLSEHFRMFTIPRNIFGDKIQPKSVQLFDTALDDNVEIFDDGYQNLIGGYNLFSRVQEIRTWPSGTGAQNWINPGTASYICPEFGQIILSDPLSLSVYLGTNITFSVSASGNPLPISFQWYSSSYALTDGGRVSGSNGPVLYISNVQSSDTGSYRVVATNAETNVTSAFAGLDIKTGIVIISETDMMVSSLELRFGSTQDAPPLVEPTIPFFGFTLISGSVVNVVNTQNAESDSASISLGFVGGYLFDTLIQPPPFGFDTQSINVGFDSGYLFDVFLQPPPQGQESQSIGISFVSGSIATVVIPTLATESPMGFSFIMVSGSVF